MKRSLLALALGVALPFAAVAATSMSYTHAQAGWMKSDTRGDSDGWAVAGSWAFHPNLHVFGGYSDQNIDEIHGSDFDQWNIGAGYNRSLTDRVDFVTRVGWRTADFGKTDAALAKTGGTESSAHGYTVEVGVRGAPSDRFEAEAAVGYGDLDFDNGEVYGVLGGQLKIGAGWGIAGDVKLASGDTQYFLGSRLSW